MLDGRGQAFKDVMSSASKLGGLIAALATVLSGGWFVFERLEHGHEAYAQVRDLKDDVEDLEKRYNAHIDAAWKKLRVEEAKEKEKAERGAPSSAEEPNAEPEERDPGNE